MVNTGVGGAKCLGREKVGLIGRDYDTEHSNSISRISSAMHGSKTGQLAAIQQPDAHYHRSDDGGAHLGIGWHQT